MKVMSTNHMDSIQHQYNTLNVYDVLNADKFIIAKDAVAKLEEVYA